MGVYLTLKSIMFDLELGETDERDEDYDENFTILRLNNRRSKFLFLLFTEEEVIRQMYPWNTNVCQCVSLCRP